MVIFKCYFSGELIALSEKKFKKKYKKKQQRCEHRIRKNKQIKSTVHDANKKMKGTRTKHENKKHLQKSMAKKEALYKQTALVKAANSIK